VDAAGEGADRLELVPSALLRVAYLIDSGDALGAQWSVGASVEEGGLAVDGVRFSRSIGLVIEAHAR
jgi:hypothetical protein